MATTRRTAASRVATRPPALPAIGTRFADAERHFRNKLTMTRAEFDALRAEVKTYAFTVARTSSMNVLSAFRRAVQTAIENGETIEHFRARAADIMEATGFGTTPWHIDTIFRTNMQQAYGSGLLAQYSRVTDAFPFWQYVAINDSRVRPSHRALHLRIYPALHPFWKTHFPPWEYNCRCDVVPMTAEEVGEDKVSADSGPQPTTEFSGPGAGLSFNLPIVYSKKLTQKEIGEIEQKIALLDTSKIDEGPAPKVAQRQ